MFKQQIEIETIGKAALPGRTDWRRTAITLPTVDQNDQAVESLRQLERQYRIKMRLDSTAIHRTHWTTDLLAKIYKDSYPLRGLNRRNTTVKISRKWLAEWELFAKTIIPYFSRRFYDRVATGKHERIARIVKTVLPLRTFIYWDPTGDSVDVMQKVAGRIEYESGAQTDWRWLATCRSDLRPAEPTKGQFVIGVDGDDMSMANMRAWHNKIINELKIMDVFVSHSENEADMVPALAFALLNLAPDGAAAVCLPRIASTSVVSMIHLFCLCFESTTLRHLLADDRVYLYGERFLDVLTDKHRNLLYEFCEASREAPNISPFSVDYVNGEQFVETVDAVIQFNRMLHRWRYEYYERVLIINQQLSRSSGAKLFGGYVDQFIDANFHDETDRWIGTTGFNFFPES